MLVFSSAEMTNSSFWRGLPFQERPYRSRMRLALTAKLGSRGKIQVRWYQGRMASAWSHRQMVLPEMVATKPAWQTWRAMSGVFQWERGTPYVAGNSQARALT